MWFILCLIFFLVCFLVNSQSYGSLDVQFTVTPSPLCVVFILQKGYALDPDGVRCKTIEKLIKHFYDFTLPRCDVKLTAPYK